MIFFSVTVQPAQPEDFVTADVRAFSTVETAVVDRTVPLYADAGSSDRVKDASTDVCVGATELIVAVLEGDGVGIDEWEGLRDDCGVLSGVCGLLDVIEFDGVTGPEAE